MFDAPRNVFSVCAVLAFIFCVCRVDAMEKAFAAKDKKRDQRESGKTEKGKNDEGRPFPPPKEGWRVATIILTCPTDKSVRATVRAADNLEGYIEYGPEATSFTEKTEVGNFKAMVSVPLRLNRLGENTAYAYRFRYRVPGERAFQTGPTFYFHTQRAAGSPFTFEVQGDSHPERAPKQNDPALYERTLLAVAKDRPDFFICLGDDFSVDALSKVTADSVTRVYLKQLPYLGLVARSSPLFLVNGNHEQAARCNLNGSADNVAVWARRARELLFPQPEPDEFYSGDTEKIEHVGLPRDYYAWTWGDALFVAIDPYWHSKTPVDNPFGAPKKHRDLWDVTLGDAQYRWLRKTLEESRARHKFVFAHHVSGTGRGGIENADYYEWGGYGAGGEWEFDRERPGWGLPIHQLMAKNGVTIFFQGHDHIFARQRKDGVTYQTLPEPADPNYSFFNRKAYRGGDLFPNSGRVRVTVTPEKVRVEYIRSYLPGDGPDGEIAFAYEIPATKK